MRSRSATPSGVSILATSSGRGPAAARTAIMSSARHTNDTATDSMPSSSRTSSLRRSSSVGVASAARPAGAVTPGRPWSRPPLRARVRTTSPRRPSTTRATPPVTEGHSVTGLQLADHVVVGDGDAQRTAGVPAVRGHELDDRAGHHGGATVGEGGGTHLRPGEISEHRHVGSGAADPAQAGDRLVDGAMGEGEAGHVHPGLGHLGDRLFAVRRRPDRRHDAGAARGGRPGMLVAGEDHPTHTAPVITGRQFGGRTFRCSASPTVSPSASSTSTASSPTPPPSTPRRGRRPSTRFSRGGPTATAGTSCPSTSERTTAVTWTASRARTASGPSWRRVTSRSPTAPMTTGRGPRPSMGSVTGRTSCSSSGSTPTGSRSLPDPCATSRRSGPPGYVGL